MGLRPIVLIRSAALGAAGWLRPRPWPRLVAAGLIAAAAGAAAAPPSELPDRACLIEAAALYRLPVLVLAAIRMTEAGAAGDAWLNPNGSVDYGVMQINSIWLPELEPKGYNASVLANNPCDSIMAGAWILSGQMQRLEVWNQPDVSPQRYWEAIGAYHSRTPQLNRRYAELVWSRYAQLREWHPELIAGPASKPADDDGIDDDAFTQQQLEALGLDE